jgi:sulfite exporter TauE/SafE
MPPYAAPWPGFDPSRPAPLKTHSPALIAGGIVLTGVGAVSAIGGVTAIIADVANRNEFKGLLAVIIGVPLLAHGLGCLAGGIPMIAIGAKKIPFNGSKDTRSPAPFVMVTPRSAALRWTF